VFGVFGVVSASQFVTHSALQRDRSRVRRPRPLFYRRLPALPLESGRQLVLRPGVRLGPYEILSALGAGGMGGMLALFLGTDR